ncbi:hypothetical protein SeMB42_g04322 [Synchytrium endobioticum]|uniref:Uncharacterized protein n=1 Tax=Synchytrium endobioticum TaxID=286115 RepID=A0A507CZD9_9FUNG|nr:hypothetical protein SeMB42_g04322 [Synchytrium endobioticum]
MGPHSNSSKDYLGGVKNRETLTYGSPLGETSRENAVSSYSSLCNDDERTGAKHTARGECCRIFNVLSGRFMTVDVVVAGGRKVVVNEGHVNVVLYLGLEAQRQAMPVLVVGDGEFGWRAPHRASPAKSCFRTAAAAGTLRRVGSTHTVSTLCIILPMSTNRLFPRLRKSHMAIPTNITNFATIILDTVPPPSFSDGNEQHWPDGSKFVPSDPARTQRFLDKLTVHLKHAYLQSPHALSVAANYPSSHGPAIKFHPNARCHQLPAGYKLFESRPLTPLQPSSPSANTPMMDLDGPESDADGCTSAPKHDSHPSTANTKHHRSDSYVFGHPHGKFRTLKDFGLHIIWLISDSTHNYSNCKCKNCIMVMAAKSRRGKKPYDPDSRTDDEIDQAVPDHPYPGAGTATQLNSETTSSHELHFTSVWRGRGKGWRKGLKGNVKAFADSINHGESSSAPPSPARKSPKVEQQSMIGGSPLPNESIEKYKLLKKKVKEMEAENGALSQKLASKQVKISLLKYERRILTDRLAMHENMASTIGVADNAAAAATTGVATNDAVVVTLETETCEATLPTAWGDENEDESDSAAYYDDHDDTDEEAENEQRNASNA